MAPKSQRSGAKKLDMGTIRASLADGRVWTAMGVVRVFPGESAHYEIDLTSGVADVLVDVELAPNGERLVCRLASAGGLWRIPAVGTEVAIVIPEGDFDADALIVGELSSGAVPDGLSATVVILAAPTGGQVLVHDGVAASAVPLATKADLDAVVNYLKMQFSAASGHIHAVAGAATSTIAEGTTSSTGTCPAPVGTTVLKGK